jgi:protein FAM32A
LKKEKQERDHEQPKREKTKAELEFEELKRSRVYERVEKNAEKSHKQKITEFNKYLNNLSEHHDIPRVGPG